MTLAVSSVVFAVFRSLASGAIGWDCWRHRVLVSSSKFLCCAGSIRGKPRLFPASLEIQSVASPPYKVICVYSRHASVSSVTNCQAGESCSVLVVSHHLDGLLRNRPSGMLQPVTAMRFNTFQAPFSAPQGRKRPTGGWMAKPFPHRGSHPSKNPPCL